MSATQFLERLFGDLSRLIPDEDSLRKAWSDPEKREHFLDQLADQGYDHEKLDEIRSLIDAKNSDLFDVLSYILFTHEPLTREQRANATEKLGLETTEGELKNLLIDILQAYVTSGEGELGTNKLSNYLIARYGSVAEGRSKLGEISGIKKAYYQMQARLYSI